MLVRGEEKGRGEQVRRGQVRVISSKAFTVNVFVVYACGQLTLLTVGQAACASACDEMPSRVLGGKEVPSLGTNTRPRISMPMDHMGTYKALCLYNTYTHPSSGEKSIYHLRRKIISMTSMEISL